MNIINGKLNQDANKTLASCVSSDKNHFGTLDLNIFKNHLLHMSLEAKGCLANKVGVRVTARASKLDALLIQAFNKFVNSRTEYFDNFNSQNLNYDPDLSKLLKQNE